MPIELGRQTVGLDAKAIGRGGQGLPDRLLQSGGMLRDVTEPQLDSRCMRDGVEELPLVAVAWMLRAKSSIVPIGSEE